VIKISISGDSSSEMKDNIHLRILQALGPFTEEFPNESVQLSIRKEREKKVKSAQ
jgi:hypothetical protein